MLLPMLVFMVACGSSKEIAKEKNKTSYSYTSQSLHNPKREFRGAWLSTAWQDRYQKMNSGQMKQYFRRALDDLQQMGINTIIFQVRPQADAFYKSKYEPWSKHLSGIQGVPPDGDFDPLKFLIDECHERGMELHAWLNPYRVTISANEKLSPQHIYFRKPELFVSYGDKIYFDPGLPESRKFICLIVKDIISNYDVDAIHMDDYFYPYPIAGKSFPDDKSFMKAKKENPKYAHISKEDWRRENVNELIRDIKETIVQQKPWVKFGISPFGIYRNKKSTPDGSGSETYGLQNYDDLYADVKLWVKNGWIDYNMPQIYWERGNKAADYDTLVKWWSKNNYGRPLIIGQDVKRTMNVSDKMNQKSELDIKLAEARNDDKISGNCFWPAYSLLDNYKGIGTELATSYHKYPALNIAYTHMSDKSPEKVKDLKKQVFNKKIVLTWEDSKTKNTPKSAFYYVVYRFDDKEKEDLNKPEHIVAITNKPFYEIKAKNSDKQKKYKYVVTAVNRYNNESQGKVMKVKY